MLSWEQGAIGFYSFKIIPVGYKCLCGTLRRQGLPLMSHFMPPTSIPFSFAWIFVTGLRPGLPACTCCVPIPFNVSSIPAKLVEAQLWLCLPARALQLEIKPELKLSGFQV